MNTLAVVLNAPEQIALQTLALKPPSSGQIVVQIEWSGISTGTERLLWSGRMPHFPGMGYPLVPGYESVGRVIGGDLSAPAAAHLQLGDRVFVPGASCYSDVRGLFGGAASRVVVPAARLFVVPEELGEQAVLLALSATAEHALAGGDGSPAELIIGHGVLGRLLARLSVLRGGSPVVWEKNPDRRDGAVGYTVCDPDHDPRPQYRSIYDVSGDAALLPTLIARLQRGGEIVLAGFYSEPLSFAFAPAFLKEARLRVAAEWQPTDLQAVCALAASGRLGLDGLISHRSPFDQAPAAYAHAFADPHCLKMLLDWRACS